VVAAQGLAMLSASGPHRRHVNFLIGQQQGPQWLNEELDHGERRAGGEEGEATLLLSVQHG
jgi:hypothetical protein